jgi:hypothetical protein
MVRSELQIGASKQTLTMQQAELGFSPTRRLNSEYYNELLLL